MPQLDAQLARGEFANLFGWLRTHVHAWARRCSTQELMKAATGKPLSAVAFVRYAENKYLESSANSAAA